MKDLKWIAIQPLTGGMYLGAEEAIGCPAQCILSFDGLNSTKKDKTGNIVSCSNEYHLTQYLKKVNRSVPYYIFNGRAMFQNDYDVDVSLVTEEGDAVNVTYDDIDLVCAVPVCSGLSTATIASNDVKEARNCNMKWLAKYTIEVIKPKIYIFENAPTLYTNAGKDLREWFAELAKDNGYSVIFYKTDTQLHNNCQRRPRTFGIFIKGNGTPDIGFENAHISVKDFYESISKDTTQWEDFGRPQSSYHLLRYFKEKFGEDWIEEIMKHKGHVIFTMSDLNLWDEFNEWVQKQTDCDQKYKDSFNRMINHIHDKLSRNMGFYFDTPIFYPHDYTPSAIFKTIPYMMTPDYSRFITCREALSLMGMPEDFELQTNIKKVCNQIGQNVPVKTAKFIVGECVKFIKNWDHLDRPNPNVLYANNIKQRYENSK